MNRYFTLFVILLLSMGSFAQTFTDLQAGLTGLSESSNLWVDYNEDGRPDFVVMGNSMINGRNVIRTQVYKNTGRGMVNVDNTLPGLYRGDIAQADYNLDGIIDLVLLGETSSGKLQTTLYRGTRSTNFIAERIPLPGLHDGSADWGDYDGDGDPDLLLTGNGSDGAFSGVFRNDREKGFFLLENKLPPVAFGTGRWVDFDLDGDLDIILSGGQPSGIRTTLIMMNNKGVFVPLNAGLVNLQLSDAAWADYDLDGDPDVVLTGEMQDGRLITQLYNNIRGVRFEPVYPGFIPVRDGSVDWGDMDHDGDPDLLITGESARGPVSKVYRNDRGDIFTDLNAELIGLHMSDGHWADYDQDGDLDILISGLSRDFLSVSRIYRNDPVKVDTVHTVVEEEIWNNTVVAQGMPVKIYFYVFASCWCDLDGSGQNQYNVFVSPIQQQKVQYELQRKFNKYIIENYQLWYDFDQANIITSGFSEMNKAIDSRKRTIEEYESKGFVIHEIVW